MPRPDITLRPDLFFEPSWFLTCRVKVLVVTDGSGGFGETAGFHLGQVLRILGDDPWSHVRFVVTKAHRQGSGDADVIDNFRFDAHDLSQYSQVWLFGVYGAGPNPLGQAELRALAQFMDQGGGVFATGDHQNLGQAICAEVPRVRSMRRWYFPGPGPNGEPVAPDQSDHTRHDTVMDVDPLTPGLQGDQSDKVPQPIRVRQYTRRSGGAIIYRVARFPHPVLCGPDGVIAYLPDHMHEGLCEVPDDLTRTYTFDGYTTTEYPIASGTREEPQVIAWGTTRNTDGSEFGILAAYDGHRAGVGRVVVDATWHHWFNINLVGLLAATDPLSPAFDPSVVPKWEAIKAYFRNVGAWLARGSLQDCLRNGGWIIILRYYDIIMTHRKIDTVRDPLHYYWQLGVFARDALGRLASQCQTTRWIIDVLEWVEFPIDPWRPVPPRPLPDPPPWLDLVQLENVATGGAVHALMEEFRDEKDPERLLDQRGRDIEAVARRGAALGVLELLRRFQNAGLEADNLAKLAAKHG